MATIRVVSLKNTLIAVMLGLVLMLVLTPISVHGESNPYILLDSDKGVAALVSDVNSDVKEYIDFDLVTKDNADPKKVYFSKVQYLNLKTVDKREVMKITLNAVKNGSLGSRDTSRLYNFIEEQDEGTASAIRALSSDVSTDLATASSLLRPFSSPISIFLGLASIIIFFMLTVAITVDICFLTIPLFQAFVMRNDQQRPTYISQEAWDAMLVAESNLGTGNASVWGVYFRSRTKTLVIVGITLGYLIGGKVFDFAVFIVDVFLSFFN